MTQTDAPITAPAVAVVAATPAPFSLRAYLADKQWGVEARRVAGFGLEIVLVQSLLYFWLGVGLGYSLDRISRALSPAPTPAERAEGRVDRGRLARDLCVLLPLYVTAYLGVRTLTNWLYEILVWRPILNRHAPHWFHHESYKLHMAYAMILGMVWTSPTTSAKTAALCGL